MGKPVGAAHRGHQADDVEFAAWSLDHLVDHIVSTHHGYVRAELPAANRDIMALLPVHGERHPELLQVAAHLAALDRDLRQHLAKEELVLFPYVRELARGTARPAESPFGTVSNPIRMMEREHVEATATLTVVRGLTDDYRVPPDADAAYAAALRRLEAFERDLLQHIHLEDDILFPRALECERGQWRS